MIIFEVEGILTILLHGGKKIIMSLNLHLLNHIWMTGMVRRKRIFGEYN